MEDVWFGGKFRLGLRIGAGSFGTVYKGIDVETGREIAIKLEATTSKHHTLKHESEKCHLLAGGTGLPALHWYGEEGGFCALVLDLLGPSLGDLLRDFNYRFSLKTVLMAADQIIDRIEYLHDKDLIHRDIKPSNFCIGLGDAATTINIIDFGLSKSYRDPKTLQHTPLRASKKPVGTAQYASLNVHASFELSRRDDMESIGYMLIYFLRGLPWEDVAYDSSVEKWNKLMQLKMAISLEELCQDCPSAFAAYFKHCRSLRFEGRPDYAYLRRILAGAFNQRRYQHDLVFDWNARANALP